MCSHPSGFSIESTFDLSQTDEISTRAHESKTCNNNLLSLSNSTALQREIRLQRYRDLLNFKVPLVYLRAGIYRNAATKFLFQRLHYSLQALFGSLHCLDVDIVGHVIYQPGSVQLNFSYIFIYCLYNFTFEVITFDR